MRRASLAALTLAAAAGVPAAVSQGSAQALSDDVLSVTLSQSFGLDSNYGLDDPSPGTSTFADTGLALGYARETATQSFSLGLDTGLRALWEAEEDFEFTVAEPTSGRIAFAQEGPGTALDASASVRTRTRDFQFSEFDFDDDGLPVDLDRIRGDTREIAYAADLGLTLGTDAPSSYGLRFGVSGFDYTDTEPGDNLSPRQTLTTEASWELRVTPVLATALTGSYLLYEADDAEETELTVAEVDAGLIYEPDETLRLGAGLGWGERERTENGEVTESDSGPTLRGDLRFARDDLTLTGNARWTAAAPESRLSGSLRGVYTLPRGTLRGRVFQRYSGGAAGNQETRITGAGIGLERLINEVSTVGIDFAYAVQENLDDPDDPDTERADVTASYSYALTAAVDAEIGYTYRNRIEDPEEADSHRVFVTIGRTFETGL